MSVAVFTPSESGEKARSIVAVLNEDKDFPEQLSFAILNEAEFVPVTEIFSIFKLPPPELLIVRVRV